MTCIKFKAHLASHQRVVVANRSAQVKYCSDSIEKDRLDHSEFKEAEIPHMVSQAMMNTTAASVSHAKIEGMHQKPNNASSAARADETGARRPSWSRSIPTVI